MPIDLNDEILHDFLIEAGEIIEELGEQLVQLEVNPDDSELLNSIFRGFHTVKGGAGFLAIDTLVEICHRAEDVFNVLRQGDKRADQTIMDVILQVHDILNDMFSSIQQGIEPEPADRSVIKKLELYSSGGVPQPENDLTSEEDASSKTVVDDNNAQAANSSNEEITDDEFDDLLDQLHGDGKPKAVVNNNEDNASNSTSISNEITDDDFEKLLDDMHGNKSPGGITPVSTKGEAIKVATDSVEKITTKTGSTKDKPAVQQGESTVRVDTKRLDDIMNLVGELVLVRNRLSTIGANTVNEEMAMAVGNLDLVTSDLQTAVMKTRMQPIKKVFGRFPRIIRDLSRSLNKEVTLELVGEETDLDKNLVEALADPLVHLIRNAVDHGIEMPDVREQSGKSRSGTILLSAEQEGDHILLTITDDGAGMDADVLRKIAIDKGVVDKDIAARLTPRDCYNLIFMPGFSTKSEISDISGRGVGMDVVKTKITQLNGTILVDSEKGQGSKIEIKVPLTLAIMPTLMVMLEDQVFALPLGSVVEIFHLDLSKTKVIDGQEVVLIRDKAMPIFYLREWLVHGERDLNQSDGHLVVVNSAGKYIGFVVDKLLGQEEVVIKPLGALLNGTEGLAGATITGNGKISLILDVPGLMVAYANRI